MKKIIIPTIIIAILFFVFTYINSSPYSKNEAVLFEIKRGSGLSSITEELSKKGLIRSVAFFKIMGKIKNAASRIKAGFYSITKDHSSTALLSLFIKGKVHKVKITIPEGKDNKQIAEIMEKKKLATKEEFLLAASNGKLLKTIGFDNYDTTEGFLFPDTYYMPWGATPQEIILIMLRTFKQRVSGTLLETMKKSRIGFYKSLILASIVAREAVIKKERPVIAGVFLNRYKRSMKFESCATIQYILGEVRKKLFYSHLKRQSPYNTYIHKGFPPSPIGNPGMSSIKAAANPEKHRYLYFVAKNDGSHHFSRSGREHNRAARKYQWK